MWVSLDEHEEDPHFLSKAILRHLQQQEKEEFFLFPPSHQETSPPPSAPPINGNWRAIPEPMSREPTIMISLEKPQPLKVPVESTDNYQGTE